MMCLLNRNFRNMNKWVLLAAAVFLAIPVNGSIQDDAGKDPYMAGRALMEKEHFDSALFYLEKALEQRPGDTEILYYLGICHFTLRHYPAAYDAFYEVERRREGMASFYLAKTEMRLNHPVQAMKYLRIHLDSRYKLPEDRILLDEDLSELERLPGWQDLWNEKEWYDSGDKDFQEALFLKEHGSSLDALNLLNKLDGQGYERSMVRSEKAAIYASLGNGKAARSELRSALQSDVRNLDAVQLLARYQVEDGDYEDAIAGLSRVIRQDPARFDAYLQRGRARSLHGDLDGALEDVELYLLYFPEDDRAIYQKGVIQFDHRRYLDAIHSFNRALQLNSGRAEYFFARGKTYAATGTTRYAENDMSMALDLDPLNGQVWFEKGKLAAKLGKSKDACHCFERAYRYGVYEAGDYLEKNCRGQYGGRRQ
jgi:tetratricopeptide (TPR) repeat protein